MAELHTRTRSTITWENSIIVLTYVTKIHDYTKLQRIVTCSDDTIRTMGGYSRRSAGTFVCTGGDQPAPCRRYSGRGPAPPLPYHPTSKRRVVMPPPRIERCTER